jgi:hypothetical protein
MKKIYPILFVTLIISSCSKDAFKTYENRLIGTWHLVDVDRRGFGGSLSHLPFTSGDFTLQDGGKLIYNDPGGNVYEGSWDLGYRRISNGCSIDENGNQDCQERSVRSLHLTAIDFSNQDVKSENFDEITFTSADRFKAKIQIGLHTYVFIFRR